MGPGPSTVPSRVLRAMSKPTLGHLDPRFIEIMGETMDLLRYVFQTKNEVTLPMSGTGSAGMETVLVNLLEPGDKAIICICGAFGLRMADIAERCGARVVKVESPWGYPIYPDDVQKALAKNPDARLLAIVHAETSTGVLQPLQEISRLCKKYGVLLVVDTVTSLGGVEFRCDEWGVDAAYSGTQKCLNCPPGLSPVTFSPAALERLEKRKSKVSSWYLDMTMIRRYWGQERFYHHTAPVNMIYALNEALQIVKEEGLENRWARHRQSQKAFIAGIKAMGLDMLVDEPYRLPSLNTVKIPDGIDDAKVRGALLKEYNIEIGGGLGELKGKVWRIGLMGNNARKRNVIWLLSALEDVLSRLGYNLERGSGVKAASLIYEGT
ncbi:MAG TPA: alanine--glyoxylate aminotransferase family protein [Firmicutes bacterium]|nr:alanine--glyoxylate aminotransferase family protein [Bacillota bacterium]